MKHIFFWFLIGIPLMVMSQTNIFPENGKVGIGTTTPYYLFDVINTYATTEAFLRFRVADAPEDYLAIDNSTGSAGQFIPKIAGFHSSDNRYSVQFMGITSESNDVGTHALVNFDARRDNAPIQTRPLFVWTSWTTKMMTMLANGNLGIGTTTPDSKLAVNGKVHAKEVKVDLTGWPDYVFQSEHKIPTLEEVERHIVEKGHLINIPKAEEVEVNGIELGEMNRLLLEKIEELTLYAIQQQKEIQQYQKDMLLMADKLEAIQQRLNNLKD